MNVLNSVRPHDSSLKLKHIFDSSPFDNSVFPYQKNINLIFKSTNFFYLISLYNKLKNKQNTYDFQKRTLKLKSKLKCIFVIENLKNNKK